jgi:hypothetical protein
MKVENCKQLIGKDEYFTFYIVSDPAAQKPVWFVDSDALTIKFVPQD